MSQVKVDIEGKFIVISGEIQKLPKKQYLISFFTKQLKAEVSDDFIKIEYDNKMTDLQKVNKLLNKFNVSIEDSESVDYELNQLKNEQKKFELFSKQALDIRNNFCDVLEFNQFVNSVEKKFPKRILYPLQLLSAYHLAYSQNACNFSVPGAGKTSIVYAAYAHLNSKAVKENKYVNKILVIGPLSSFGPWENEYSACFGIEAKCQRLSSNVSVDKNFFFETNNTKELVLISYQGILNVTDSIINYLKRNNVMIVLDEAHKIKNVDDGSIANAVLKLSRYAKARIILTGTPVPNGYEDLYNIFKFIWPTQNIIGFHPYQLKDLTDNPREDLVESLVSNIEPFFIRIRKSDMGEMPLPTEIKPIIVEMDPDQRLIYDSIEKRVVEEFLETEYDSFLIDLKKAKLIRLMQAASNLNLLKKPLEKNDDSEYLDDDLTTLIREYKLVPQKFYSTLKLVNEIIAKKEKIIIWCTYIDNILELSSFLHENGILNKLLYGDIPTKGEDSDDEVTREKIIDEFHYNDALRVIIANPHAVGESISLHKACHNALYFEKSFNATHFLQSRDRIHRYGLKKTDVINYYYLITKDSIDESIHERLFIKKKRMEDIIERSPIPLFDNLSDEMGNEDIKSVVRAYVKRNNH